MLETLWYLLILVLQILQVNPQLLTEKLQIDVIIASKPAYSFVVKGNTLQGQMLDADTRSVFGEFESTRRVPQVYVVFPRTALPAELEAAAMAALRSGKDGGSGKDSGSTKAAASPSPSPTASPDAQAAKKELYPFTIDFTKAIKQLVAFRDKPRQSIEYPETERFLSTADKAAKTTAPSPSPSSGAKAADKTPTTGKETEKKNMIEIRQFSNRLVLSAEFIQTVIIVNFMP